MQALPHLCKRGNVYQWRRRSHRLSTGIVDLKLSLGTTDLGVAHILSRRISAESDIVMGKIERDQITAEEARRFLAHVVRTERQKIERLKLMQRFDSDNPVDDLRHDNAARAAWKHIATAGLNASQAPEGAESHLTQQHLDLIRADLKSDVRLRIVARDFKELTGRDTLSAFDIITVMNLLIDGKAAAWNRHDSSLEPISSLADQICAADPGFLGPEPVAAPSVLPPLPAVERPEARIEPIPLPETAPAALMPPQPDTSALPASDFPLDCTIAAVVGRMNELKRSEKVEEKTLRQYESFASLFTLLTGISDLRHLRQHHATAFRAELAKLPKSWGKSPADHTATRDQLMERARKLPPEKVGLAVGTINRHLEHLGQIVEFGLDEGMPLDQRLKPTKLRRKDNVRDRDKKEAFTENQVRRLFRGPVWRGSESEYYQTRPGPTVYENGLYWCPLIGAYTGARREEIAGLAPTDIIEINGIQCFSIEDSELRRIKNISSKRLVPIHQRLIALGFLDLVKRQKSKREAELFPELREPATGLHGRKLGRRMRQIVDETFGAEGEGLSFHSLRHYVQNALEDIPDVKDKAIRDLLGHEGKDVHDKTYGKQTPVDQLLKVVNAIPVVF